MTVSAGPRPSSRPPPHGRRPPPSDTRPRLWLLAAVLSVLLAAAIGAGAWMLFQERAETGRPGEPPLIRADLSPVRVPPDDPGGMEIPNQDRLVLHDRGDPESAGALTVVDELMPPPEEPLPADGLLTEDGDPGRMTLALPDDQQGPGRQAAPSEDEPSSPQPISIEDLLAAVDRTVAESDRVLEQAAEQPAPAGPTADQVAAADTGLSEGVTADDGPASGVPRRDDLADDLGAAESLLPPPPEFTPPPPAPTSPGLDAGSETPLPGGPETAATGLPPPDRSEPAPDPSSPPEPVQVPEPVPVPDDSEAVPPLRPSLDAPRDAATAEPEAVGPPAATDTETAPGAPADAATEPGTAGVVAPTPVGQDGFGTERPPESEQILPPAAPQRPTASAAAAPSSSDASATAAPPSSDAILAAYRVQVAALASEAAAAAEFDRLRGLFPEQLGGLTLVTPSVVVNGSTLYRVQAGPLGAAEARSICAALEARGQACIVRAP